MQILNYQLDNGYAPETCMGLIVLQTDETVENDFRQIFAHTPQLALYHSRIANATEVSRETLQKMGNEMPQSVSLLPAKKFKTIGYACTSGATVIGSKKIEQLVQSVIPKTNVTDPIRATLEALDALSVKKLAFVTPYVAEVSEQMRKVIVDRGREITAFASFNQSNDELVARISPQSILQAIVEVSKQADCDAVFVSCTNLRALQVIAEAEKQVDKPVLSSNQVLAWHMLRLTGISNPVALSKPFGRLFSC